MATDFVILRKGLKQLAFLLIFLISAPLLLNMAFKALVIYKEGSQRIFSIVFVVVGSLYMLFAIVYAFRTFRTLLSSIFNDK